MSFSPLQSPAILRLGHFWDAVREHFPHYEEQAPHAAPIERFDPGPVLSVPGLELAVGAPPPPRSWFLSAAGDELLQVQPDWFACNWRKVSPGAEYGRWPSRWEAFERWFELFEEHVAAPQGAEIAPTQCEVTYVNHIETNDVWRHHGQLASVVTLAGVPRDLALPDEDQPLDEAEGVSVNGRYLIRDEARAPVGRLYVTTGEAFKVADRSPVIQLTLTARGAPEGPGLEGVRRFAERAHQCIVRGFCALTTPAMHQAWGRRSQVPSREVEE